METLPNGVTYPVLDLVDEGIGDNTEVYKVPENHFFMMGDNRDNSTDSRFLSEVGYVPFENLVGRGAGDLLLHRRGCELLAVLEMADRACAGRASSKWCIEPCPSGATPPSNSSSNGSGYAFKGALLSSLR